MKSVSQGESLRGLNGGFFPLSRGAPSTARPPLRARELHNHVPIRQGFFRLRELAATNDLHNRPAQIPAGTREERWQGFGNWCFALVLTLTACASTSLTETEDRIVIHHGLGGHLQSTEAVYEDIEATGKPVVIDGHLHSADALYALSLPGVCYTPNAVVSLHAVSYLGLIPSRKHTGRMAKRLPGPVEAWFRASMAFYDPIGWAALDAGELGEIWPDGRLGRSIQCVIGARPVERRLRLRREGVGENISLPSGNATSASTPDGCLMCVGRMTANYALVAKNR